MWHTLRPDTAAGPVGSTVFTNTGPSPRITKPNPTASLAICTQDGRRHDTYDTSLSPAMTTNTGPSPRITKPNMTASLAICMQHERRHDTYNTYDTSLCLATTTNTGQSPRITKPNSVTHDLHARRATSRHIRHISQSGHDSKHRAVAADHEAKQRHSQSARNTGDVTTHMTHLSV